MGVSGKLLRRLLRAGHGRWPRMLIWPTILGPSYIRLALLAPAGSEARRRYAAEALRWQQREDALYPPLGDSTVVHYFHLTRLGPMAWMAFESGDLASAERFASEALRIPQVSARVAYTPEMRNWRADPRHHAVHDGHIVLGKIALTRDDVAEAIKQLEQAGKVASSSSPAMNTMGPDRTLAQDLLQRGQTEPVKSYLVWCRGAWSHGVAQLDDWIQQIQSGFGPDLSVAPKHRPSFRGILRRIRRSVREDGEAPGTSQVRSV